MFGIGMGLGRTYGVCNRMCSNERTYDDTYETVQTLLSPKHKYKQSKRPLYDWLAHCWYAATTAAHASGSVL